MREPSNGKTMCSYRTAIGDSATAAASHGTSVTFDPPSLTVNPRSLRRRAGAGTNRTP